MEKGVALRGCVLHSRGGKKVKVSDSQLEVLKLLGYPNCLTQEAISIKRKSSRQAVNKIVKKLKEKGLFSKTYNALEQDSKGVAFSSVSTQPKSLFRFHNMRWTLKILSKSNSHKGKEQFTFNGNKIKVWENVIEIYSKKHFLGDTPADAYENALVYWYKIFVRLENRCNVVLIKDQYQNIQLTKCELANTNNEIAKDYILKGKKFQVKGSDGKVWCLIDNSFGQFEFETINASSVKPDMERMQKVLNDYRDNPDVMTPKEMHNHISQITNLIKDISITHNKSNYVSNNRIDRVEQLLEGVVKTIGTNAMIMQDMIKELESLKTPNWKQY